MHGLDQNPCPIDRIQEGGDQFLPDNGLHQYYESGVHLYLRRRSRNNDLAALIAAFGSQVDHPVAAANHIEVVLDYPHNSRPRPANAAARLKQELAATSAAGAFDADSSGSEATAE